MKKNLFLVFAILILAISLCGASLLNTKAEESDVPKAEVYYKSIQIRRGDSLWTIAEEYAPGTGMTTKEYVRELMQMNNLKKDVIHAGYNLTVMYCTYEE